ncbi:MAG: hypothetical protein JWP75_1756 [Frondihabitans sp.]|nr:hypothetical protein [Frondihabitans sp.]
MTRKWTLVLGSAIAVFAALQWVVIEAVVAAAWTNPSYSYAVNYISDLGTTTCGANFGGRVLCSPLSPLMNTAFATQGILFAVAAILLSQVMTGRGRVFVVILGLLQAAGMVLVAIFHGQAGGPSAGLMLHIGGAGVAILAANLIAIFVGLRSGRLGASLWYRILSVTLGAGGIVSELVQGAFPAIGGALERGGVYSYLAWQAVTGIAIIVLTLRKKNIGMRTVAPEPVSA